MMLNFKRHTWRACLRVRKIPKDTETKTWTGNRFGKF